MKHKKIAVIVFLLISNMVFLSFFLSEKKDKNMLQEKVDQEFALNLQELHNLLHRSNTENMDEEAMLLYQDRLSKSSGVCEGLLSVSSYKDITQLPSIMWYLIQMTPPKAYYQKISDPKLIEALSNFILNMHTDEAENLAEELWQSLSLQQKRVED